MRDLPSQAIPETNLAVVRCLYKVEVSLRELIIESLSTTIGPRWFKQRVPAPIYAEALRRQAEERTSKWTSYVNHHPIYYTNFTELKVIIERKDNWQDVFKALFGDKEVLVGTLVELDPIRNKAAHNRLATDADVQIARTAAEKLANTIGTERFERLVARCTSSCSIRRVMQELCHEAEECYAAIRRFNLPPACPIWTNTCHEWWFDDDYLGTQLTPITKFFQLIEEYRDLPRGRGKGHKLEEWLRCSAFEQAILPVRALRAFFG